LEGDSSVSTETRQDSFITVHTETPGDGSPTETSSPPTVTAAGSSLSPYWSSWAPALVIVLATVVL
jgi:hypothetical protein